MSERKHTPGPWWYDRNVADTEWLICCDITETNRGYVAKIASTNADDEANAQLIASAPELLEALEAINSADAYDPISVEMAQDKARAAIARATGKEADQ